MGSKALRGHNYMTHPRLDNLPADWQARTIEEVLEPQRVPVAVADNVMYRQIGIRSHGQGIFYKELVSGETIGKKRVFLGSAKLPCV